VAVAPVRHALAALVLMHFGPSALPVVESLSGDLRFAIIT
jgi:hypothetical protein